MKKLRFGSYKGHVREHNVMLKKLVEMDHKIINDDWN